MASYAAVTAVSFPAVHGEALVCVQAKPVSVPGGKPVIVLVAPTLPTTTEVPVSETLPPRSPKEVAAAGISKIGTTGLPKAGIMAADSSGSRHEQIE
jgi:hypothetical protein